MSKGVLFLVAANVYVNLLLDEPPLMVRIHVLVCFTDDTSSFRTSRKGAQRDDLEIESPLP
jgi:hypothetical protein